MKTIEEVLAMDDAHRAEVPVPEWETHVLVVSMTGTERADLEKIWSKREASNDPANFRCDVLLRSLKGPGHAPWGTPEQIAALIGKNADVIERLFDKACELSGLTKKDVQGLVKN